MYTIFEAFYDFGNNGDADGCNGDAALRSVFNFWAERVFWFEIVCKSKVMFEIVHLACTHVKGKKKEVILYVMIFFKGNA